MSLVSRFPLKASNKSELYHEESTSNFGNEPHALIIEPKENTKWDDKILSQPVCCQSSLTNDITEHSEGKEAPNSNDSPGTASSADETNVGNTKEHHSLMSKPVAAIITQTGQEKPCYGETQKELTDIVSSQCSVISSQISAGFSIEQNSEKIGSCSDSNSDSNSEAEDLSSKAKHNILDHVTSFRKLLETMGTKSSENHKVALDLSFGKEHNKQSEHLEKSDVIQTSLDESMTSSSEYILTLNNNPGALERHSFDYLKMEAPSCASSNDKVENHMNKSSSNARESENQDTISQPESMPSHLHPHKQNSVEQQMFLHCAAQTHDLMQKASESNSGEQNHVKTNRSTEINADPIKPRGRKPGKDKMKKVDWDNLRVQAQLKKGKREKTADTMDSLDWDAVRCANVSEIADAIKERGMNNMLAERIQVV